MENHSPHQHACDGFSLIEVALVLIIIALLLGSALSMGGTRVNRARLQQTYDKLEMIERALASFVKINGRLPCPADPRQARLLAAGAINPNLGLEDCTANTRATIAGVPDEPDVFAGTIPTQALNLSPELMLDGWERRFTYLVDERMVDRENFAATDRSDPNFPRHPNPPGAPNLASPPTNPNAVMLSVWSGSPGNTTTVARTRFAAYVVISHGENGQGAWNKNGVARLAVTTTDAGQIMNARNWWAGGILPNTARSVAQTMRTAAFDDIVHSIDKETLLRRAGVVFQARMCRASELILMPPRNLRDTVPDFAIEGPIGCETGFGQITGGGGTAPPGDATYTTFPRDLACVSRQMRLAQQVRQKCLR